jgi:hypothetical protein
VVIDIKDHCRGTRKASRCYRRQATRIIRGSTLSRVVYDYASRSYSNERYTFCGSTLSFRGDYSNPAASWVDTYEGTWRVTKAKRKLAQVAFTTSNFKSTASGGAPGADQPPPSSGTATIIRARGISVLLNGVRYRGGYGGCA